MLKHFSKITGTGKFLQYRPSALPAVEQPVDFGHFNLVYGENGSGKTTLSLLFRSLRGEDGLLLKKRSFDRSVPQEIEVVVEGLVPPQCTYSNGKWDQHLPGIEVFDVHFINDNVYTGLEIQNSHKKNLFEVILGQQGVQLKSEIQAIKERIMKGNKMTRETARDIEAAIDGVYLAIPFAEMPPERDIEAKIAEKAHEITTARSFQDILQKAFLSEIPMLQTEGFTVGASEVLAQSTGGISEQYLAKFNAHKVSLDMGGHAEDWLKQGYQAIHDDTCPFCQRPFDATVDILEAYRQYFNESYNRLIADISRLNDALNRFNLEARLLEIERTISQNLGLVDFWKNYLEHPPALHSLQAEHGRLAADFERLKTCFEQKAADPSQPQDAAPLTAFEAAALAINEAIQGFNEAIIAYNGSISLMKSADGPDLPQLELDMRRLVALQKKDNADMAERCKNLLTYEAALEKLKRLKNEKQAKLDQFKNTVFDRYLAAINRYLQAFASYLELRQLTSHYIGSSTEPSVKFALCIAGKEVLQKDDPDKPSVKYSLSEGDKNAFALSFFLASLELDPQLSEKIIVFDDPVSHFDEKRTETLLNYLVHFGQQAQQVFLLTHDLGVAGKFEGLVAGMGMQRFKLGHMGSSAGLVAWERQMQH
ncbi:MAG: AAA family ATPase [Saprospiraceae bacterium]|nr:AAA family ATPase [Saprospiraceae bacterium]MCF8251656.1 AAA family ATPase [Saprospiraceae bacterium]MCF8281066.1 AAA family ATPase [Bacteroidales bacterium]MCF8313275.1 AAA family ATPase [Saprospiraceae bacterium]MCF8442019.1 AAA family ATPase [Saprospiraceae bacterium]